VQFVSDSGVTVNNRFFLNLTVKKNYENWYTVAEVIEKIKVGNFFETWCMVISCSFNES